MVECILAAAAGLENNFVEGRTLTFAEPGRACRLSVIFAGREGSWAVGRRVSAEEVLAAD